MDLTPFFNETQEGLAQVTETVERLSYTVRSVQNATGSGVGNTTPTRMRNGIDVPPVSALAGALLGSTAGESRIALTWVEPGATPLVVDHYCVYVVGAVTDQTQETQVATTHASPAVFTFQQQVAGAVTFAVQTVLANGQVNAIPACPTCTVVLSNPLSSSGVPDPGGNGLVVRTALGTSVNRSVAVGSAKLTVTNGDGVAGNPTLDFGAVAASNLTNGVTGSGAVVLATSPTVTTPTVSGTESFTGAGGGNGIARSHPILAALELGTTNAADVLITVNAVGQWVFLVGGGLQGNNLPSTDPGAGTKQLWYDPADGNRVKYRP